MGVNEKIRSWARRIKRDGVTLWFAYKHPRIPFLAKALSMFAVAYALSPIDLVPDFIPVLGYLDDVIVLPALIWLTIKLVPADVLSIARHQADNWMEQEGRKLKNHWGIALVAVVWIAVAWGVWHYVISPRI